jgi:Fur family ferric uptake transcriptional regulator
MTCGHVEEFYDPAIEERQQQIAAARGFRLEDHALSLYAVCTKPDCAFRNP